MITAIVTFDLPDGTSREDYFAQAEEISARFQSVPGLLRKNFLYNEDGTGGGAYTWQNREAANAFYNDAWRENLQKMFGATPDIRYFDSAVIVDNEAGDIKIAA